jgi:hypothetical protein
MVIFHSKLLVYQRVTNLIFWLVCWFHQGGSVGGPLHSACPPTVRRRSDGPTSFRRFVAWKLWNIRRYPVVRLAMNDGVI